MPLDINNTDHKAAVIKALEHFGNDGHTIWKAEAWVDTGLPIEFLTPYVKEHQSGDTPKGMIFGQDNTILPNVFGIYGLPVLRAMARDFGCQCCTGDKSHIALGRGSEAQELTRQLHEKLEA